MPKLSQPFISLIGYVRVRFMSWFAVDLYTDGVSLYLALDHRKTERAFAMKKVIQLKDLRKTRLKSSLASLSSESRLDEDVKPYSAMPSPPAWPLLGHIPLLAKKENQERLDQMFHQLRLQLGDIYRLSVPGQGDMVVVFRPEDVRAMYASDGRIPYQTAFEALELLRGRNRELYKSTGLLTNSEEWYEVRQAVQQDMMKPKSALFYISDIEEVAEELVDKVADTRNKDGDVVVNTMLNEYALDAVGVFALGTRLGSLQEKGDGKKLMDLSVKIGNLIQFLIMCPAWSHPYLPQFRRLEKLSSENYVICKKHVDAALARVTPDDQTLIAKLARKCGKESPIIVTMGADSLAAGLDTTGSSGAFLLYHLASNPEKQEKLYQEICNTIGPHGKLTEATLGRMRYLKACQTESQRLLPASFGSSRLLQSDLVLGGFKVPAGSVVLRVGTSMSRDAANFAEPDEFVPERWVRGDARRHTADSFSNLPFGHGVR